MSYSDVKGSHEGDSVGRLWRELESTYGGLGQALQQGAHDEAARLGDRLRDLERRIGKLGRESTAESGRGLPGGAGTPDSAEAAAIEQIQLRLRSQLPKLLREALSARDQIGQKIARSRDGRAKAGQYAVAGGGKALPRLSAPYLTSRTA